MAGLFLRLGCALVSWILAYSHAILLAVVPQADCSPALWRTTLLFAGLGAAAAALLPLGLPWREWLRWISVPLIPLLLYGAWVAWTMRAGIEGAALCETLAGVAEPATGEPWHRAWPPIQLVVTLACTAQCLRFWRPAPDSDAAEHLAQ